MPIKKLAKIINRFNAIKHLIVRTFNLSLPVAATNFFNVFNTFIGVFFLARLGNEVLAASALIVSLQISAIIVFASILFSKGIIISNKFGSEQYAEIGEVFRQGYWLAFILSIFIIIIFWNSKIILVALGQKPELAQIAQNFFRPFCISVPPTMWRFCNQQMVVAVNKPKLVLLSSFLTAMILIPCAYSLSLGKWGLPNLGVQGLAIAYDIQAWAGFFILFSILFFNSHFEPYQLFQHFLPKHFKYIKKLFTVGWPICVQTGGELYAMSLLTIFTGWMGVKQLAAVQITSQINMLVIVPIFGIVQAAGILVGQARGAKNYHEVRPIGYICVGIGMFLMLIVMLIYLFLPKFLASWYINIHDPSNAKILTLTVYLFYLSAIIRLFDSTRNILTGALRGFYDTRYPMYVSFIVIWLIGIPISYVFGFIMHFGVVGLMAGFAIGVILGAIFLWIRWEKNCRSAVGIL